MESDRTDPAGAYKGTLAICNLHEPKLDFTLRELITFIDNEDHKDSPGWRNFAGLRVKQRYSVKSSWYSALATKSIVRARKMLAVLRNSRTAIKQLPKDLEDRIWWYVFMDTLSLVFQGVTTCILIVKIGLEKVRREETCVV